MFLLENDALNAIDPICCSTFVPHWSIASIIADIKLLSNSLSFLLASNIVRTSNSLAHSVAHWACFCKA